MSFFAYTAGLGNGEAFAMQIFFWIGIFGLFMIVIQAVFGMVAGHDGDTSASGSVDMHGGHGAGTGYLSLRSVSAMLLGLGFGGAILIQNGFSVWIATVGGLGIGLVIGLAYVALMNALYRLRSDGTSVLADALNRSGTVYVRVPGNVSGAGEIQVSFGGRLQNIKAYTRGFELATGTAVRVIGLHGDHALLVEKLS